MAIQEGLCEVIDIIRKAVILVCWSWPARDAGKNESIMKVSDLKE